ncbi:MAG: ester cyclase [Ignavibacteriales bacterium]|nr:ester cyclase [Ignavibacteriales bacterium]
MQPLTLQQFELQNKRLVVRYFEEVQNKDNADLVDTLFSPEATFNGAPLDLERLKERIKSPARIFKDFIISIHEVIPLKDYVIARTSGEGIHVGEWFGFQPASKRAGMRAIDFFRISNGKIVEHWHIADRLGALLQLELLPLKKGNK